MEAKTKKWLIIGGIALAVITITTIVIVRASKNAKKRQEEEDAKKQQEQDAQKQQEQDLGGSSGAGTGSGTLPNNGVGCGSVKTDYDGHYYYVKCNGVWYTKTKPNVPVAPITSWLSLSNNLIASQRLNNRYPNG